jgi:hypothetical protein
MLCRKLGNISICNYLRAQNRLERRKIYKRVVHRLASHRIALPMQPSSQLDALVKNGHTVDIIGCIYRKWLHLRAE